MKTREPVGVSSFSVAEREGFEPSVPVRVQRFSRPSRSATPAPFQYVSTTSSVMLLRQFCLLI